MVVFIFNKQAYLKNSFKSLKSSQAKNLYLKGRLSSVVFDVFDGSSNQKNPGTLFL